MTTDQRYIAGTRVTYRPEPIRRPDWSYDAVISIDAAWDWAETMINVPSLDAVYTVPFGRLTVKHTPSCPCDACMTERKIGGAM